MPADKPNSIANHTYEAHVSSMTALVGGAVIKNAPRVLHKFNVVVDDTAGSDVYYLHIRDQAFLEIVVALLPTSSCRLTL